MGGVATKKGRFRMEIYGDNYSKHLPLNKQTEESVSVGLSGEYYVTGAR